MPTIIDEFPRANEEWDAWCDGRVWEFTAEELANTTLENFRMKAHNNAKKRGKKLRTSATQGGGLIIEAYIPTPAEAAEDAADAA